MDAVKKPDVVVVHLWRSDSEYQQFQAFGLAAVMVGGELGQAVLSALAGIRDDVIGRAV